MTGSIIKNKLKFQAVTKLKIDRTAVDPKISHSTSSPVTGLEFAGLRKEHNVWTHESN